MWPPWPGHPRRWTKAYQDPIWWVRLLEYRELANTHFEPSAVEINLRSPSMLHGKKGFERIVWAFKNVLNHSVTWLFHDFTSNSSGGKAIPITKSFDSWIIDWSETANDAPITKHHPVTKECLPQQRTTNRVRIPNITPAQSSDSDESFEDWALETYEWLSLIAMESPRVYLEDAIDPFLSRYQVPDGDPGSISNMAILTWTGFIPNCWIRTLFIHMSGWACFSISYHLCRSVAKCL